MRNLIAHAPKKLAEEIAADFSDMVYAKTAKEVATRRKAFIRKWRLKCRAVADSLEEAGDKLFTFTRLPVAHPRRHPHHLQRASVAARPVALFSISTQGQNPSLARQGLSTAPPHPTSFCRRDYHFPEVGGMHHRYERCAA